MNYVQQASGTPPKVGVVTVTYNSAPFLGDFFASLQAQVGSNWHLYCIDNQSVDSTPAILAECRDPWMTLILNSKNLGVAAGNNQGIVKALADGCEWVLLLNNDTTFPATLFSDLVRACDENGWRACVPKIHYDQPAGRLWYAGGGFNPRRGDTGYHVGKDEADRGQYDQPGAVDYSPTCCMIVHRSVFGQVGLMDETYFVYFDDTDFCWRLRDAEIAIGYWPRATLVHRVGGSTGGGDSPFAAGITARNRLYFLRRHRGLAAALMWWPVFVSYYLARYGLLRWRPACLKASLKASVDWWSMKPVVPQLPANPEGECGCSVRPG